MAKVSINIVTGSLQEKEAIVGIDLGTTNSLVAIVREDDGVRHPVALRETDGLTLVPSVVYFGPDGTAKVGTEAKEHLVTDPERTVYSAKRLMGKSYKDVREHSRDFAYQILDDETDALVKVRIGDRFYTPIELSASILHELKSRAEHLLKTPVTKAVITVPAYFNDSQRQATRDAGKLAGLDVLRIVNEPTAAALAYGIGTSTQDDRTVAVYDLGGGTFDVSILRIEGGVFEVLSTHGDTYLGGDDFDAVLTGMLLGQEANNGNASERGALRLQAEEVKKHLSDNEVWEGEVAGKSVRITKAQFEDAIRPLVDRTLESCRAALKDAGLKPEDINAVVLVGGSTRVPMVKQSVGQLFGKEPFDNLNPDEVVALGAAVQADILAGNNTELLLLDVTPLSLGLETMGGLMDVLIPRNSKIPTKAGRQYTTQKDGQGSMRISVYQGERDLVQDNRKLAEFNLRNIPAMPAGLPKVEVTYLLDADGILRVSATELRSGVAQSIDVKPQYGLTDAEVEEMLLASLTHAKEDAAQRALVEARTEAQQMLDVTESFLSKNRELLSAAEVELTIGQMQVLREAMNAAVKDAIQTETERLNDATRPFAERVMDAALKEAMRGKKIV
jgi:molecular chaperone HscA